ncbi:MAG: hypothetical protein IJ485_07310 [Lachnospiraceae bacterium]|nr:hypothetical protein [Lachnospiraceae bacterium]
MKKKTIGIGIVAFAVICIVIAMSVLAKQRGGIAMVFSKPEEVKMIAAPQDAIVAYGRELMTTVDNEEEAKEVAELYGITFVRYADGIAEYTTDRALEEVIAEGEEKGYPILSINYIRKPMNE